MSGVASAKAAKPIQCKGITGSVTGTITLTQCTGGNTGGSSTALGTALQNGGTITWASGSTTTVSVPTLKVIHSPSCSGSESAVTATVTNDTGDGIKVPGKFTGTICLQLSGTLNMVKTIKIT